MSLEAEAAYERLAEEHPDVHLSEIQGRAFIWRPLSRDEYRSVRTMGLPEDQQEELVCATCCLWPEDYDWLHPEKPGFPTSLCNDILRYSGFVSWEEMKADLARLDEELGSFDQLMDVVILAAFPSVRPEEPGSWPMRRALWTFSRAKWILDNIHGRRINVQDPARPSAAPVPGKPSPAPTQEPVDGYGPESNWWPDEIDGDEIEEIPEIDGFPEAPKSMPDF